jgi:hypothetical protein
MNYSRGKNKMLSITIGEALQQKLPDTWGHYLYLYRDGIVVLYVGRSEVPIQRLREHLGERTYGLSDYVGHIIESSRPESFDWGIDLFTLEDCEPFIRKYSSGTWLGKLQVKTYERNVKEARVAEAEGLGYYNLQAVKEAELVLMRHYRPCLNRTGRWTSPLPERYRRPPSSSDLTLAYTELQRCSDLFSEILDTKTPYFPTFP